MSKRTNPLWTEVDRIDDKEFLINLIKKYELIFDNWEYGIYLLGQFVKLKPQEYNFLRAILQKNGRHTKAEKIMTEIGSKCNSEKYSPKSLSYRIKSKIKNKILKTFESKHSEIHKNDYILTSPSQVEWIILDENYQDNGKFFQNQGKKFSGDIEELQYLNLKEFIDDMIRVKAGYYSTIFRKK